MTEAQLQRVVAKVLDASGLLWYHGPNEGKRNPRTGAALKAAGMKAGFPDVVVFEPYAVTVEVPLMKSRGFSIDSLLKGASTVTESRVCCGLAIELKVGRNKPTASQLQWDNDLRVRGWRVEVCYTLDEVLDVLRECYPHKFQQ